jgi:hypothetical protein
MKKFVALGMVASLCMGLAGCEDGGDRTTVNQAPESVINVPTNGTTTVADLDVNGNQNTTIVYIQTTPGMSQVYSIDVKGNSNHLGFIATQPVPVEETEPETP